MAFQPLFMKNVDLILGDVTTGTNFKCQMRSIVLTPNVDQQRIKTACPTGQYSNVDDPEWSLDLGYLYGKDATTAEAALGEYLRANVGEKVDFLVRFDATTTDGYSGVITVIPGPIGGSYGQFSEQSVSLPLDGQPLPVSGP